MATDASSTRLPPASSRLDAEFNRAAMRGLGEGPSEPLKKGHPPGLYLLFVTEMWERFSFYGMRAFLFLYVTTLVASGGLGWTKEQGGDLMAWYAGLVYLTPILGGYIADRYLGTHWAMVLGGLIIAAGHFTLAFENLPAFYSGLALIIAGTGLFKSNVSTMVGQLYPQGDPRRDAGFTIFYMGINVGAFLGPLVCGQLRTSFGWSWGFAAAGVGMVLGLIAYFIGRPSLLRGIGDRPKASDRAAAGDNKPLTREEWQRIAVIFIMAFFVIFFWVAFEQASTSMSLFAENNTDRTTPGIAASLGYKAETYPQDFFQSVNPFFIIALAPVFAWIWVRLARRGWEPSTPVKFGLGLIFLGLGFVFMVLGAQASETGAGVVRVSAFYLLATYFMATLGELCLSPVGLSMVTKLAPVKFGAMLMGVWFLANFAANWLAGKIGGRVDRIAENSLSIGSTTLTGQALFFSVFVAAPILAGLVLLALSPVIKKMMHGRG